MNYVFGIVAILACVASCFAAMQATKELYEVKRMIRDMNILQDAQPNPSAAKNEIKAAEDPDDAASNAERLYMEGIQAVLNYDADVMKKHLRGSGEE